jgi:DHA1 family tetracycline resistance protein-like MFS transporter
VSSPSRRTQFLVIFLTILLSTIGFGVCIPVLPLYAQRFNTTDLQNGLLVGIFSLVLFVAAPWWGRLSDRIGRRPVLIVSILGSAVGYCIMGWAGSLMWLFVARIIDGISGGNVAAAQAYLADISKPEERSKAMGLIGAAFGLGFVIGPAIGGILSTRISPNAPFFFVAGLCVLNAVLVYRFLPESRTAEQRAKHHEEQSLGDMLAHADAPLFKTVLATYVVSLMAFSIMTAIFALFAKARFGMNEQHVGYVMAAIGLVGVVMQGGVIRRLLPKFGEVSLARAGFVTLAISFVLLPIVNSNGALYAVSCLIALGNSLVQPTLNGLGSRSVEGAWQGRAMGILQGSASLGRGIGAIFGGVLLHMDMGQAHYGRTPFWVAAVLMVITLGIGMKLHQPRIVEVVPPAAI